MATYRISPGRVGAVFRAQAQNLGPTFKLAARSAAERARLELVRGSPVFDGLFRRAWRVAEVAGVVMVVNDAPYAGVIERGARPHAVSAEGIDAIAAWAQRRLGLDEKAARSAAFAIATNIRKRGFYGDFIVESRLNEFTAFLEQEVTRYLGRALSEV